MYSQLLKDQQIEQVGQEHNNEEIIEEEVVEE